MEIVCYLLFKVMEVLYGIYVSKNVLEHRCKDGEHTQFLHGLLEMFMMQRWIKELENESCSGSVEDGTESTSSQQSTSSRSTPNPLSTGTAIPARRLTYVPPSSHITQTCVNSHIYYFVVKISDSPSNVLKNRRAQRTVKETPRQIRDDTSTFGPPPSPAVAHHPANSRGPPPPAPPQHLRLPPPQWPDLLTHPLAVCQPLQHAPAVWSKETAQVQQIVCTAPVEYSFSYMYLCTSANIIG